MDTRNDRGGIEQADDKGTDAEGQGQQSLDQTEDGVLSPDKDGPDGNERHEHGHEHGDERSNKESNISGTILWRRFSKKARMAQAMTIGITWP